LAAASLAAFAADPKAPSSVVLCPAGRTVEDDVRFLRDARRAILWPVASAEIWSAIAGLRGSHDAPPAGAPPMRGAKGRHGALLLEGIVTLDRARRAADSAARPRDWIVERVQNVSISRSDLDALARQGIRWTVLYPVRLVALAASDALIRARARWARLLPPDVAVWPLTSSPESRVPRPG
jgi:hypothetical protein